MGLIVPATGDTAAAWNAVGNVWGGLFPVTGDTAAAWHAVGN